MSFWNSIGNAFKSAGSAISNAAQTTINDLNAEVSGLGDAFQTAYADGFESLSNPDNYLDLVNKTKNEINFDSLANKLSGFNFDTIKPNELAEVATIAGMSVADMPREVGNAIAAMSDVEKIGFISSAVAVADSIISEIPTPDDAFGMLEDFAEILIEELGIDAFTSFFDALLQKFLDGYLLELAEESYNDFIGDNGGIVETIAEEVADYAAEFPLADAKLSDVGGVVSDLTFGLLDAETITDATLATTGGLFSDPQKEQIRQNADIADGKSNQNASGSNASESNSGLETNSASRTSQPEVAAQSASTANAGPVFLDDSEIKYDDGKYGPFNPFFVFQVSGLGTAAAGVGVEGVGNAQVSLEKGFKKNFDFLTEAKKPLHNDSPPQYHGNFEVFQQKTIGATVKPFENPVFFRTEANAGTTLGLSYYGQSGDIFRDATAVSADVRVSASISGGLDFDFARLDFSLFGGLKFVTTWVVNTVDQMTGAAWTPATQYTPGQMTVLIDDIPDIVSFETFFGGALGPTFTPSVEINALASGKLGFEFGAKGIAGGGYGVGTALTDDGLAFGQYKGWLSENDISRTEAVIEEAGSEFSGTFGEGDPGSVLDLGTEWIETGNAYSDFRSEGSGPRGRVSYDHGKISDYFMLQLLERDFSEVYQAGVVASYMETPENAGDVRYFRPMDADGLKNDSTLNYIKYGDLRDLLTATNGHRSDGMWSPFYQFGESEMRSKYLAGTDGNWQEFDWDEGFDDLWPGGMVNGRYYGYGGVWQERTGPRNVERHELSDSWKKNWLWDRMSEKLSDFGSGLQGVDSAGWSEALIRLGDEILDKFEESFALILESALTDPGSFQGIKQNLQDHTRVWMDSLVEDMRKPLWLDTSGGAYTQAFNATEDRVAALKDMLDDIIKPAATISFGNGQYTADPANLADVQMIMAEADARFDFWKGPADYTDLTQAQAGDLLASVTAAKAHVENIALTSDLDLPENSDHLQHFAEIEAFLKMVELGVTPAAPLDVANAVQTIMNDDQVSDEELVDLAATITDQLTYYADYIAALTVLDDDGDLGKLGQLIQDASALSTALVGDLPDVLQTAVSANAESDVFALALRNSLTPAISATAALQASMDGATALLGDGTPQALFDTNAARSALAQDMEDWIRVATLSASGIADSDLTDELSQTAATQSTTFNGNTGAYAAIDGNLATMSHTANNDTNQWLSIDLGRRADLAKIDIYNRDINATNGANYNWRLADATVDVLLDDAVVWTSAGLSNAGVQTLSLGGVVGDEVRFNGAQSHLQLREVDVFGHFIDTNLTDGLPSSAATQSSTLAGSRVASHAIDGDFNTITTTAGGDANPWLSIDLGQQADLSQIDIYNRDINAINGENYNSRLADATVDVLLDDAIVWTSSGLTDQAFQSLSLNGLVGDEIRINGATTYLNVSEVDVFGEFIADPAIETVNNSNTVGPIGQAGSLTVTQLNSNQWFEVTFDEAITDAVVVLGPVEYNGVDPSTTRVRNVTDTGFEFQIDEWNYKDGSHAPELVSWLAVSAGEHRLANGSKIVAGTDTVGTQFEKVSFGTTLSDAIVLSEVTTVLEADAVTTRQRSVTSTDFEVRLQEEEALGAHVAENVSWIAIETGTHSGFEAVRTPNQFNHTPDEFVFNTTFDTAPVLLGDMQSFNGGDTATVRFRGLSADGVTLHLEEETSRDSETGHVNEVMGYLALEDGFLI